MTRTNRTPDNPGRRRKRVRAGVVVIVVLGLAQAGYWAVRLRDQRRQAELDTRAARAMAETADRKDFLNPGGLLKSGQFDLATLKKALVGEVRRQTLARVDGYFGQKTDAQRKAYLDRVIDEANAFRKLTAAPRPTTQWFTGKATPRGKSAMVDWAMQQPLATRVRMSEFGAALNARLAQRKLPRIEAPLD